MNRNTEEKIDKGTQHQEQQYIGSLLFWLHILFMAGMVWIGVMVPVGAVWAIIVGYGLVFAISARMHRDGRTGKALMFTVGSVFLGLFLFTVTCLGILANINVR